LRAFVCSVAAGVILLAAGVSVAKTFHFPTREHFTDLVFLEPEVTPELEPRAGEIVRAVYGPGLIVTKQSEGWSSSRYNDSGPYCTIGYGHLIKKSPCDGDEPAEFLHPISLARGEELLTSDMLIARKGVVTLVTADLTDWQYAAICDFVFNVGVKNFKGSTLLKLLNSSDSDSVPGELNRWVRVGNTPNKGLANRRRREIALVLNNPTGRAGFISSSLFSIDVVAGETK
jgi:lysozyme